jgi:phage tail-like protein
MTIGTRRDPYRAFNFSITLIDSSSELLSVIQRIDQIAAGGFAECAGLHSSIELEEHKEGGNNSTVLKFPTRATFEPITLKRGVGRSDDIWQWHNSFILGRGKRRDGLVVLHDEARQPVKVWAFHRGIPTKYGGPSLVAADSAVAIEELEITHEGLALISPSANTLSSVIGAVQSAVNIASDIFG